MDKAVFDAVLAKVPKFNHDIASGLTSKYMAKAEEYVDSIWRATAASFPPGLIYIEGVRCTPEEEFALSVHKQRSRSIVDLAPTDTYLMRYNLAYRDPESGVETKYSVPMELPFVGKGGTIRLNGSLCTITPVLADPVFSADLNGLFLSLVKSKENFYRITYHFFANDERKTTSVVWATLHNDGKRTRAGRGRDRRSANPESTLIHYMFAKYGVTDTFARFGADVKVGTVEEIEQLSRDEWVICKHTGIRPSTAAKDWRPTNIALAVRKSDMTNAVTCAIGGFFYIIDHYPERVLVDYIDDLRQWKILLGHVIFADDSVGEGILVERIDRHLMSLDEYIDAVSKEMLADVGIEVDTIYELFVKIIEQMQHRLLHSEPASMYNKKFMVLQYALLEITKNITIFMFELQRIGDALTAEKIGQALRKVKKGAFMQKRAKHNEISPISTPCDTIIVEHTAKVIPQASATGGGKSRSSENDPGKLIHVSIAEVGSFGNQTKPEPTGRGVANVYLKLSPTGVVERNPKFVKELDAIQQRFNR